MKKVLLILLLIIVSLILLFQIDDSINPEAQKMYDSVREGKGNKAYFYLKGIRAAVGEDPEALGRSLFDAEMKARKLGVSYEEEYPEGKLAEFKLQKDDDITDDVITLLFAHKLAQDFNPAKLTEGEKILWKRYKTFLGLKGYQTPMVKTLSSPDSFYLSILQGNELNNLSIISLAQEDIEKVKTLLLDDIALLRYQLEQADDLISKVFYEATISYDLDVLSILLHRYNKQLEVAIKPLSQNERSLVKAMSSHFAMGYELYKGMDRKPKILNEKITLPSFIVRALFKPNMTINAIFLESDDVAKNSLLSLKAFMKVSNNKINFKPSFMERTRNSIGSILASIEGPNNNQFISRMFSLDAKILLLNKTINQSVSSLALTSIKNPFYYDKEAYYSNDKKAICFDVPYQDNLRNKTRCLRVKE